MPWESLIMLGRLPLHKESSSDFLARMPADPDTVARFNELQNAGLSQDEIAAEFGWGSNQGQGGFGGLFSGGGADGVGNYGVAGDLLGGFTDKLGLTNYGGGASGGGGNRGFDLGGIGGVGIAALLGKLAYDQAKNDKGVSAYASHDHEPVRWLSVGQARCRSFW